MVLWEILAPRRRLIAGRPWRWASNLGLVALDNISPSDSLCRSPLSGPRWSRGNAATDGPVGRWPAG